MPNLDVIIDRIAQGICPICTREIGIEYQIIEDPKYGKVRICKKHEVKLIGDRDVNERTNIEVIQDSILERNDL